MTRKASELWQSLQRLKLRENTHLTEKFARCFFNEIFKKILREKLRERKMKLIFFDVDGTVIEEQTKKMPPSTKRAIEKARKNGHICVINTGRTWKMVNGIITNDTVFDGYVLGCGTMVTYRDRVLFHKIFARELACRIVESLRRNEIDAVLEGGENNFCDGPERIHTPLFHDFIADLQKNDYGTFENSPGHFDKLFAYTENTAGMDAFIEEFSAELDFVDREGGFYEIMPKGISKASGMRFLAQHLQIPMCDTVAIGDSSNDIPMLECANISIAMGNGSEEVLKMADYVTGRADQDGIERALGWLGVI